MRALVVVVAALVGCMHVNRVTLAASSLALACDWGQTYSAAARGWPGRYEDNPLMGTRPSTVAVASYFSTAILANALLWVLLPDKLKSAAPLGVLAVEYNPITDNVHSTRTVCGL